MVNNSTNVNKTNNHLSLQITKHKKKTRTYDIGNPDPGLGQAQKNCLFVIHPLHWLGLTLKL
jgi:hypothetical protein